MDAPDPDVSPTEIVSARTKMSRTFSNPVTGLRQTELSGQAINFKDAQGAWQPIDNTLSAKSGGGWSNGANAFKLTLPKSPGEAVTVATSTDAASWVSMQLAPDKTPVAALPSVPGARAGEPAPPVSTATGKASAQEVTYADALPGVDVAYASVGDAVKESVTLDSLSAVDALPGGSVTYTVRTGAGMDLKAGADGSIAVLNAKGDSAFTMPAPFMDDDAGEHSADVTTTLTQDKAAGANTWSLTLTPSRTWLAAASRAWPVVLDPTISYPSPMLGCWVYSEEPTLSSCAGTQLPISWNSSPSAQRRAFLRFDELLNVVPADAQIVESYLKMYVLQDSDFGPSSVDVKQLLNSFTSAATWNKRNSSTNWDTPGGDRGTRAWARATLSPNGTFQNLEVTPLVQLWVEGSYTHYGFSIEKTSAAAGGDWIRFGAPTGTNPPSLFIDWDPRTGNRKGHSAAVTEQLSDRTAVQVNPATGNAAVSTKELAITGMGIDLNVAHTSQSLDAGGLGGLGYGWTSSLTGARIQQYTDRNLIYTDGAGAQWVFSKLASSQNTWVRPDGLDADLIQDPPGTWTLKHRKSRVTSTFTNVSPNGASKPWLGLREIKDRNGNKITFNYDSSARSTIDSTLLLRSVTDTRGRTLTVTNPAGTYLSYVTDSSSRQVLYDVNTSTKNLTKITDAAGGLVKYEYDSGHRVTAVVTPENKRTEMQYDSSGRITQLKRVSTATGNPTWTFAYTPFDRSSGAPATKTTVTDPLNHVTEYTSDGRGRVAKVKDARGKEQSKTYSPNDDVATTTGATSGGGAQTTTNSFDGEDTWRLTSTTTPTGSGTTFSYGTGDQSYDVKSATDQSNHQTQYDYNGAGDRTTTTRPDGKKVYAIYEGDTDPAYGDVVHCGPGSTPAATKKGALCETRDASYVKGSSRSSTSAHRTAYRYDTQGQLVTRIPPGGGSLANQTYQYDGLSRLTQTTDGKAQTTIYGYDALDRRTFVQHQDGSKEQYSFGSGANNGWLQSLKEYASGASSPFRTTTYGRDDLGRLTSSATPEGTMGFGYDKASNLTSYTDNGGTVGYGYNVADQLTSLTMPGGNCSGLSYTSPGSSSSKCVVFNVDDDGRRTGVKYPGGSSNQVMTLDKSGRIQKVVSKTGSSPVTRLDLTYSYDDPAISGSNKDSSLVQAVTDALSGQKTTYTHDSLDRLTVASTAPTGGGAATAYERFCYDSVGNRTKYYRVTAVADCNASGAAATWLYNGADQITAVSGVTPNGSAISGSSIAFDANGNETAAKSYIARTASYGDRDQVSSFTPSGQSAVAQKYSGTGNRDRVLSGSTTFVPSVTAPAPAWSATSGTSTWTVRDPKGQLMGIRVGSTSSPGSASEYYPFTDNLGNVRAMVTATGTTPSVAYTYSAYGATTSTTGSLVQPYRYGQGYTDTATGLIKLGVRYYDPIHGRFTQPDPTGQEANAYAYGSGCPSSYNDPSGGFSAKCAFAASVIGGFAAFTGALGGVILGAVGSIVIGAVSGIIAASFVYGACTSDSTDPVGRLKDGARQAGVDLIIGIGPIAAGVLANLVGA